jgi:hypothetical protein
MTRFTNPVGSTRCVNRATTRVAPTRLPVVGATLVVALFPADDENPEKVPA